MNYWLIYLKNIRFQMIKHTKLCDSAMIRLQFLLIKLNILLPITEILSTKALLIKIR